MVDEQRISVALRIRPPVGDERFDTICARRASDDRTVVLKPGNTSDGLGEPATFEFDAVFDANDDQVAVYEECVQELIDDALSGVEVAVLAYGQTGSGKTYTIIGSASPSHTLWPASGIFLRVFHCLLTYRQAVADRVVVKIALSAIELYLDEAMDLLASRTKLKLRETSESVHLSGVRIVEIETMEDVVRQFDMANSLRSVSTTHMNDSSSRSHAFFFIDLFQLPLAATLSGGTQASQITLESVMAAEEGGTRSVAAVAHTRSRITLVDLAGSERVKRSGAAGKAMIEAQAINQSLSTLGTVIHAMYTQATRIPFRNSKLTRLLKNCFASNTARLLLIGHVAPLNASAAESLNTLRFCDRVKELPAKPVKGFVSEAEEEHYLKSERDHDALTSEMRILRVSCFYQALPKKALAAALLASTNYNNSNAITATEVAAKESELRQQRIAAMRAEAPLLEQRHQMEVEQAAELKAAHERDSAVASFVHTINGLIEDYEQAAKSVKAVKKANRRELESQEASLAELQHEAKRSRKARQRLETRVQAMREQLAAPTLSKTTEDGGQGFLSTLNQVDNSSHSRSNKNNNHNNNTMSVDDAMAAKQEEGTHTLVSAYYAHVKEINRLHAIYITRLSSTARLRARVRRLKLLNSPIITEGTLVPDVIAFMIERAVAVSHGEAPETGGWSWGDIDQLSRRLYGATMMYPPLLPRYALDAKSAGLIVFARNISASDDRTSNADNTSNGTKSFSNGADVKAIVPISDFPVRSRAVSSLYTAGATTEYHTTTFLSSDESDEENSHHAAESRRQHRFSSFGQPDTNEDGYEDEEQEEPNDNQENGASAKGAVHTNDSGEASDKLPAAMSRQPEHKPRHRQRLAQHGNDSATELEPPHRATSQPTRRRRHRHSHSAERGSGGEEEEGQRRSEAHRDAVNPRESLDAARAYSSPDEAAAANQSHAHNDENNANNDNVHADMPAEDNTTQRRHRRHRHRHRSPSRNAENDKEGEDQNNDKDHSSNERAADCVAPSATNKLTLTEHQLADQPPPQSKEGEATRTLITSRNNAPTTPSSRESNMRYLMVIYDSPNLVHDLIKFLRGGTVMVKHGRVGKPHKRLFWVSSSHGTRQLQWMAVGGTQAQRSAISLSEVSSIQLGCFSRVFRRHRIAYDDPAFFRCFSLIMKDMERTIDVVADTLPDFEAWVVGLAHLIGVDPEWGSKPDITHDPQFSSLTFFESILCETNYITPRDYLTLKNKVKQMTEQALEALEACGNDAVKAGKLLNSLHPPQIDRRGALYMAKGELRFAVPELNLDIFRISRVWMLFQQMGLVYDDNFVPATAFGITRR